jgi:multidrug efflux system membrane fusion protein
VRGKFDNPRPPNGARLISPGMFVRIRMRMGEPRPALLVIDQAITSDQGLKYVYVVDAESRATYRRITTGWLEDDGLRVVLDGLKPDDRVVVGGLQQMRPNMEIKASLEPMPTMAPTDNGPAAEAPPPATKLATKPDEKPATKPDEKPTGSSRK